VKYFPFILLLLFGITLRLFAASGALWLDEVWALQVIRELETFAEIFSKYRSDNNHLLQSMWLYGVDLYASASRVCLFSEDSIFFGGCKIQSQWEY
jgi:hypothetical protein